MHLSITTTTVEADFHLAKENRQRIVSYRHDAQLKHWDRIAVQMEGFVLPNTTDLEYLYSSIAHRRDIVLMILLQYWILPLSSYLSRSNESTFIVIMNHEDKKNKTKGTLRVTATGYVEYHSRLSSLTTMHQLSTIPRLNNYGH